MLAVLLPLLVGFSRVVVGAHYPTDVLCGWALGLIVVLLVPWLRRRLPRPAFYAVLLLTALPGFFYCTSSRFESTHNILRCVLRTLGGAAIYFGLNTLLKLPFPKELLDAGDLTAHLIRSLRYAVVIFVDIGVYPLLFRYTGRLWKEKREG